MLALSGVVAKGTAGGCTAEDGTGCNDHTTTPRLFAPSNNPSTRTLVRDHAAEGVGTFLMFTDLHLE